SKNKEDKDVNGIIVFDKLIQRSTNLQNRIMYLDFETGRKVILLNNSISNWGEKERNLTQSYQDAKNLFKLIRSDLLGYNIEFQKRIDSLRFGWDNPMMIIGRTCKIEKLVNWIENGVSGYIHCLGSSGCGKSWFAKSLLDYRHMGSLSNSILMYHLGFGANSSQAVFISSLTEQVRTRFGLHQAILAEEFSSEAAQKRMIQFLECVKTNSDQEELILVIDGYDEVMTTSRNSITPLDFLPDEEMLPEGVFIILLGRPFDECGSIAKSAIRRLSDSLNKRMISFDEEPNEARLLVSTLVERELINQSDIIKTKVIELSEESPLRAAHFCALINTGVAQVIFSNNTSISNLYKSFLSGIEKKVGSIYFNSLYRPLLSILAVARAPLPLSFLADVIGVIQEKALIAVIDLSHLIRSVRDDGLGEVKLEIYHREYREYVRDVEADWVLGHNLLASFLTQIGSISSGNSEEYVDLYSSKNLIIHLIGAGKRAELIEYFKNTFSSGILIDPEQLISGLRPCETVASVQICLERLYLLREIFLELELQQDYKNTILVVIDANISGHLGSKNPKEASEILSSAISILESSDFLKKDYRLRSSLNYKLFEAYINLGLRDNAKIALERSIRIYETELRETQKADERALSLIQLVWYYIGMANCFSDEKNSKTQYMLMANNFLTLICDLKDLDDDVKNQKWRVEGYLYFNSAFVFPAEQQSFLERSIDAYKMAQIADPEDSQLLYSLISSMRALANFFYDHNSFYLARKILFEAQNLLDKLVRYDSSNLFYIRMKAILNRIKAQLDIQENDLASAISLMEIACSEMGKVKTSIINNAIKREYDLYLSELEEMKGRLN
ncbi:MAG: hypothetical protein KA785_02775, partial [Spirochaetaceae bacterium]|nr:hypothetical protein [Spirochaetaceae bacterium]